MLEIEGLSKKFKNKAVLDNVCLTLLENRVYGLLGPNGAGKTTLMRCMMGLYPTGGASLRLDGKWKVGESAYRRAVGYLPQHFGLFCDLKLKSALAYLASLKGLDGAQARAQIEEVLEQVHLAEEKNKRIKALSGGMLRRAGLAQALLGEPKVLVLDEPTAGLDPEERLRFMRIIGRIKKERAVLISTHIVEDVETLCDRVLILNQGKILADGSCEEIRQRAAGKVFLCAEEEMGDLSEESVVSYAEKDGRVMRRILSLEKRGEAAEPSLEDGYLCVLRNI